MPRTERGEYTGATVTERGERLIASQRLTETGAWVSAPAAAATTSALFRPRRITVHLLHDRRERS